MATTSYKCPSCGAGIEYKPTLQKFKCDYCLSEYTVDEFNKETEEKGHVKEHLNSYHCNNCGANVISEETTTATFCYYCHNPIILSDKLKGEFKPKKMIPFSIDKSQAKESFLRWAGKKRFVPKDFTSNSQLEKITGIYLPYWWVDAKAEIDYVGEGRNIRVWRSFNTEYTEVKKYEIIRKGQIDLNNISELAFKKIDKDLLNGVMPYDEEETIDFSMPYLSGFFAEQYDIEREEAAPLIEEQMGRYYGYLISEAISGFNQVSERRNSIDIKEKLWNYTLLPVWILTYNYRDKVYVFAVNGQTGRSYGELPLSREKISLTTSIIFGFTAIILLLGGLFIW